MAEITQHLGFDAGQAIEALRNLDQALGGVNRRLATFNSRTGGGEKRIIQGFAQLSAEAQKTETAINNAANGAKQFGQQGSQAAQRVTLSWETMIRVVTTQVLVRALNNLIRGFSDTADAAEEFQLQVARIANIADGPAGTVDALTVSLNELAVTLGRSIEEVGEAAFEGLQNDLGTTTETMDLLAGSANNLALVTGGTLTQAVNSISSVLKSYNLDISQADEVTDIFFGAIDAGRITLEEFQSSLGSVAPLSSLLGVSFQETAGAIAAITQAGTSAATAQTQLRNVLSKLQKPTEALRDAFTELGVASGQELIEKFGGLIPALQALEQVAAGDEEAMAAFFGTIRGNLGALNLLANDAQVVTGILDDLANSSGRAAEAAQEIDKTDARQSQKAFAQLDATLRELGETTQQLRTTFVQTFNAIIPSAEAAKNVIAGLGGILAGIGAVGLASSVIALTAAFGPLAVAIGAVVVAAAGLGVIFGDSIRGIDAALDEIDKVEERANNKAREANKKRFEDSNRDFREALQERQEDIEGYLAALDRQFERETKALTNANDLAGRALDAGVERFATGLDGVFSRINSQLDNLEERVREAEEASRSASQNLADFRFDRSISDLPIGQQIARSLERARQEARGLEEAIARAGNNPEALEGLEDIAERLIQNGKAAERLVGQSKDASDATFADDALNLQERGLKALDTISRRRVDVLKEQQQTTETEIDAQEAIKEKIEENIRLQAELARNTDAEGNLQTDDQQAADQKRIQELKAELKELTSQLDRDLFDRFGETENIQKMIDGIEQAFKTANLQFDRVRETLQAVLDQAPFKAAVQIVEERLRPTGNEAIDSARREAVEGAGQNPADQLAALREADIQVAEQLEQLRLERQNAVDTFNNSTRAQQDALNQVGKSLSEGEKGIVDSIGGRLAQINEQLSQPKITPEAIAAIENQLNLLLGRVKAQLRDGLIEEDTATGLTDALQKSLEALEQREQVLKIDAQLDPADLEQMKLDLLQLPETLSPAGLEIPVNATGVEEAATQTSAIETNLQGARTEAATLSTNIGAAGTTASNTTPVITGMGTAMSGVVAQTNNATAAMNRLEAAARRAAAAAREAASIQFAYHGGKVAYRAEGGPMHRGADTQLTVTQPGEIIMNARQSRNFQAELLAMNAGQRPQFREHGGSVTNIGDVNVNIHTNSADRVDGDQIGRSLRRQLRRETLDL